MVFWDFMVGNTLVTVHLEQGVGIAMLANDTSPPSEVLVQEIAQYLVQHAGL